MPTSFTSFLLLAFLRGAAAQACTASFGQTNYGVFPAASGAQAFCTNVPSTTYVNNALQLSRHQAAPGHRLTLNLTAVSTEACCDAGVAYNATAGTAVATAAQCALSGGTRLLPLVSGVAIPSPSSWQSNYGAQIGLCFYSDSSNTTSGISYTITTVACPAGFYCPTDSASPIACAAVRLQAQRGGGALASAARAPNHLSPHPTHL